MSLADLPQRHRLALGWCFGVAFLALARPTPAAIAAGALPLLAGAAVRTWAAGHIRKREALAVTGPYAHTRNPLYLGSFLMACGALIMGRSLWLAGAFLLFALPVYRVVILKEEQLLTGIFGGQFEAYVREVPRFFPRLTVPQGSRGRFDWGLVRRHREWRAWLGAAALILLMLARSLWVPGR